MAINTAVLPPPHLFIEQDTCILLLQFSIRIMGYGV